MSFYELWENLKSKREGKIRKATGLHFVDQDVKNYFNSLTLYELMEQLAEEDKK